MTITETTTEQSNLVKTWALTPNPNHITHSIFPLTVHNSSGTVVKNIRVKIDFISHLEWYNHQVSELLRSSWWPASRM